LIPNDGVPRIAVPVLYLDLDGTVRKGKDELGRFVNGPEDVEVFPEAVTLMRRWKERGGRIAAVTNQGGVALGLVSKERVVEAVYETQRQAEGLFDAVSVCLHHPDAKDSMQARCWCRKPSPGAVAEAAFGLLLRYPDECFPPSLGLFVGDRQEDHDCAKAAMLDFVWASAWRSSV
jgi:D-glycero-D-manno-heptose 1,7-bisphosphate phosphatase